MSSKLAARSSIGLGLAAHPESAYVSSVPTGCAGEPAGLRPGMIISHVNGMSVEETRLDFIRELIVRSEGKVRLGVVGASAIEIDKADLVTEIDRAGNQGL